MAHATHAITNYNKKKRKNETFRVIFKHSALLWIMQTCLHYSEMTKISVQTYPHLFCKADPPIVPRRKKVYTSDCPPETAPSAPRTQHRVCP